MYLPSKRFAPSDESLTYAYQVDLSVKSRLGNQPDENRVCFQVEKHRIREVAHQWSNAYLLDVLERKATAQHPLRQLENDIMQLRSSLVLNLDAQGTPTGILNRGEIQQKWIQARPRLRRDFKHIRNIHGILAQMDALMDNKELLLSTFLQSDLSTILFPRIYGESLEAVEQRTESKVFSDFIGRCALPLLVRVTDYQKKGNYEETRHCLKRTGTLDKERYDQEGVHDFLAQLFGGSPQSDTHLSVEYQELFDLDERRWITHAGQVLSVQVPGYFSYQQIMRVRPLTQNTP